MRILTLISRELLNPLFKAVYIRSHLLWTLPPTCMKKPRHQNETCIPTIYCEKHNYGSILQSPWETDSYQSRASSRTCHPKHLWTCSGMKQGLLPLWEGLSVRKKKMQEGGKSFYRLLLQVHRPNRSWIIKSLHIVYFSLVSPSLS